MERFLSDPTGDDDGKIFLKSTMLTLNDQVSSKVNKVAEICEKHFSAGIPGKILVFCSYHTSADAIMDGLPSSIKSKALRYHATDKAKHIAQFMNDDKTQILVGIGKSLEEGLNLQMASRLIRTESVWSPGSLDQAESRIFRPDPKGQFAKRDKVYFDWIICDNSIDVTKTSRLISKVLSKARFDEHDNPFYKEIPELPLVSMSMETLTTDNDFETTLAPYLEGFHTYKKAENNDFEAYRKNASVHKKSKLVPKGTDLKGSEIITDIPYIDGQVLPYMDELGIIPLYRYAEEQGTDIDSTNPVGMRVHTEFGDGVVTGGSKNKMNVRLDGSKKPVSIFKMRAFIITNPEDKTPVKQRLVKKLGLPVTGSVRTEQPEQETEPEKQQEVPVPIIPPVEPPVVNVPDEPTEEQVIEKKVDAPITLKAKKAKQAVTPEPVATDGRALSDLEAEVKLLTQQIGRARRQGDRSLELDLRAQRKMVKKAGVATKNKPPFGTKKAPIDAPDVPTTSVKIKDLVKGDVFEIPRKPGRFFKVLSTRPSSKPDMQTVILRDLTTNGEVRFRYEKEMVVNLRSDVPIEKPVTEKPVIKELEVDPMPTTENEEQKQAEDHKELLIKQSEDLLEEMKRKAKEEVDRRAEEIERKEREKVDLKDVVDDTPDTKITEEVMVRDLEPGDKFENPYDSEETFQVLFIKTNTTDMRNKDVTVRNLENDLELKVTYKEDLVVDVEVQEDTPVIEAPKVPETKKGDTFSDLVVNDYFRYKDRLYRVMYTTVYEESMILVKVDSASDLTSGTITRNADEEITILDQQEGLNLAILGIDEHVSKAVSKGWVSDASRLRRKQADLRKELEKFTKDPQTEVPDTDGKTIIDVEAGDYFKLKDNYITYKALTKAKQMPANSQKHSLKVESIATGTKGTLIRLSTTEVTILDPKEGIRIALQELDSRIRYASSQGWSDVVRSLREKQDDLRSQLVVMDEDVKPETIVDVNAGDYFKLKDEYRHYKALTKSKQKPGNNQEHSLMVESLTNGDIQTLTKLSTTEVSILDLKEGIQLHLRHLEGGTRHASRKGWFDVVRSLREKQDDLRSQLVVMEEEDNKVVKPEPRLNVNPMDVIKDEKEAPVKEDRIFKPVPTTDTQKGNGFDMFLTIANDFVCVTVDDDDPDTPPADEMKKLGFKFVPAYMFAHIPNKSKMDLMVQVLVDNYEMLSYFVGKLKRVGRAFDQGKAKLLNVPKASLVEIKHFFKMNFRPVSKPTILRPYPVIQDGELFICATIPTQPAAKTLNRKAKVPGVSWEQSNGEWFYFATGKSDAKAKVMAMVNAGYQIKNLDRIKEEYKQLKVGQQDRGEV